MTFRPGWARGSSASRRIDSRPAAGSSSCKCLSTALRASDRLLRAGGGGSAARRRRIGNISGPAIRDHRYWINSRCVSPGRSFHAAIKAERTAATIAWSDPAAVRSPFESQRASAAHLARKRGNTRSISGFQQKIGMSPPAAARIGQRLGDRSGDRRIPGRIGADLPNRPERP